MRVDKLESRLSKIYHFREIGSTNDFAKTLLPNAEEWTIVIADVQKSGKGRLGRNWYSPEGGLWFSVIIKPENYLMVPLIAGVAVCEAMRELEVDAKLKWPNDILVGCKKICGILTEFFDRAVILGIGVNLNIREFPQEIKDIATSLLIEKGKIFDKDKVLNLILDKIEEKYNLIGSGGDPLPIIEEWRSYSITLSKDVCVETPRGVIKGKAIDIAEDGALLVKLPSGDIEKIFAGDCSIR